VNPAKQIKKSLRRCLRGWGIKLWWQRPENFDFTREDMESVRFDLGREPTDDELADALREIRIEDLRR